MKYIKAGHYLSVKEYAREHGMTPGGVHAALKRGGLKGYQIDGQWIIPKGALITRRRTTEGRYVGVRDLERGDINTFLKKRGFRLEE